MTSAQTNKPKHKPPHAGVPQPRTPLSGRDVVIHGRPRRGFQDLFHYWMTVSWLQIILTLALLSLTFNLFFGLLYYLRPDSIANLNPPGYAGAFFFSVETLATVGYGDMHPQTTYGHTIAGIEVFVGLVSIALVTGVMFARFSRPRARFLFARHGVIRPINGRTTLMFRAANARLNVVMEASAQLRLVHDTVTTEGYRLRRFSDLPLVRSQHPVFALGWNLMHIIDAHSPLHDQTPETLAAARSIFSLTLSGTDETTGQVIMGRVEYPHDAIRWNHTFVDVLSTDETGQDHLDYTRFHDVELFEPDKTRDR